MAELKGITEENQIMSFIYKEYYRQHEKAFTFYSALLGACCLSPFDNIYLPLKIDFRGRIYSDVTILNFQGPDFVKALIRFSISTVISKANIPS